MKTTNQLAIALLICFAASVVTSIPLMSIPSVQAQEVTTIKTYAVSDAIPNPVGVGEQTLLKCGISQAAPSAAYGWEGLTIDVVTPSGQTETLGPLTTDSTGSTYALYVPDEVGVYNLTTNFPEQTVPINFTDAERGQFIAEGTVLLASTASSQLVVNEEPSPQYPGNALPSEYWSRPVDSQLREWYNITGNWVARPDNSLALYNDDAPETAHILWAKPYTTGGLVGGLLGSPEQLPVAMFAGDAYEGKFSNSVIINGVLYYNTAPSGTYANVGVPGIKAVDLRTGEELWFVNNTALSFGQTMFFASYNVNGAFEYLWSVSGSTYTALSPYDGSFQFQFTGVPSGLRTFGPSGEILIYQINYQNGWMALWNSTLAGLQNAQPGTPQYGSWSFSVIGMGSTPRILNGSLAKCYSWNVSIPTGLAARTELGSSSLKVYEGDRIVGMDYNQTNVRVWALPLDSITTTSTANIASPQVLSTIYDENWAPPEEWVNGSNTLHYTGATNYVTDDTYGNGIIAVWDKELRTHYGFSVVDGTYQWATAMENYLDQYGWGNVEHTWYFAYGHLYSVGVAGILYAYELQHGTTQWTYNLTDPYNEPVTGENWWGWIDLITDGKIYIGTLEHSANNPIPRGGPFACVNATDGSQIFRINGLMRETRWGGNPVIGDNIIAGMDTYDNRIYAMGKGPTQVTASAPDVSVDFGRSVMIKGTVTDISAGTQDTSIALRFPNGVPAVSDESQSAWMLYVYKQFAMPMNATGVPLSLNILDANGNYRTVASTTSDANGHYSFTWTPDIEGTYTAYVTFEGSAAYWPSVGQTAFNVGGTTTSPAPTGGTSGNAADMYLLPGIIAIIIVIIVVGAIIVLVVNRKH
jgi:hypothetical protein